MSEVEQSQLFDEIKDATTKSLHWLQLSYAS